ncbi:MAG: respiratory nitrate reductase subunit gamma [Gemmatimonadota bacterium]
MSASTLILLSYLLLAIFVVFFVLKSVKMARMPIHLRWELSPVPHEKGRGHYGGSYLETAEWWTKPREKDHVAEGLYMFKEILFLKALFEHKRSLWWFSFPFHFGMYLLIGAAALLVFGGIGTVAGIVSPDLWILTRGLSLLAGVGYALGILGAVGLFVTRMTEKGMANSTTRATYFNLLLLGAMFGTGIWAVLSLSDFSGQVLGFVGALFTADMSVQLAGVLKAHFLLAFIFLAYLPFTQMMHFVAKYFTYHDVRWDDSPVEAGGKMEKELIGLLGQKPTWAGAHVRADGKKTWVDIATDTGKQEAKK